ncbi:Deoxyribonuclease-1 like [Actinidia chinensis var. chinensis]|uniref:Deoxyribonuclease-1 like n=1 Tax=Actinidia chinensis var. chinensis TaxID=1590841 RepID=A0A2R6R6X0_ACTCC|nr:Deoxyribonuclease-1 like [Actinidia chinensis var. chinensis]
MATVLGWMAACAGLVQPKLPLRIQRYNRSLSNDCNSIQLIPREKIHCSLFAGFPTRYATSAGRKLHELSYGDEFRDEPLWFTTIKKPFWSLKSLFAFLLEQPSQLKYIEWPSFQSTLKTASLTLLLVALFMVALASVDSALTYMLALLLRKTP